MKRAVYAGSFDPPTNGHLWVFQQGSRLFDELIIAIGINPDKNCVFSLEERLELLRRTALNLPILKIDSFENEYLIRYAASQQAQYLIRGIRDEADYRNERLMRNFNRALDKAIETIFLIPPIELGEISSSFVKGLIGPEGWESVIESLVPKPVHNKLLQKYNGHKKDWDALWQRINAAGSPDTPYSQLVQSYTQPQRFYHNLVHVHRCLERFKEIRQFADNPDALMFALFYHDIIYNTHATDNEEKSAEFARDTLRDAGVPETFVSSVYNLILNTKHNQIPTQNDHKLMVDIDLAEFGFSPEQVIENSNDIRQEYSWVAEENYRKERAKILNSFLSRPSLFCHYYFINKYECAAQPNLKSLLAQLR